MENVWMDYEEYVMQSIWMQLRERLAPNNIIMEILEECKAAKFSKEVLVKYQLTI